jgi:hypothetical protein
MHEIDISQIQSLALDKKIVWTEHSAIRFRERKIRHSDLIECIKNGEIIEQYPEDTPYPSCLISGTCLNGKSLHTVIGLNKDILCCVVTAYRPDLEKWETDYKTRIGGK